MSGSVARLRRTALGLSGNARPAIVIAGLCVILMLGAFLALQLGSSTLPMESLLRWLAPFVPPDDETAAIMLLRWPRVAGRCRPT